MSLRDKVKQQAEEKRTAEVPQDSGEVEIVRNEFGDVDVEKTERGMRNRVRHNAELANRDKPKKERFIWVKMWINYLVSLTMKDRGKIPDNIGDRILITSNLYITKLYMTTIFQIWNYTKQAEKPSYVPEHCFQTYIANLIKNPKTFLPD